MDPHSSYPPPTAKKTSPWVYVGCACGVLVLLGLAAIVATTWFGYHTAKKVAEGFENPEKRAERARAVLPYDSLPEGYQALGAFSIPFVVDLAFFSTEPVDEPVETTGTEPVGTEPVETEPAQAESTEPEATGTEPASAAEPTPADTPAGTEPEDGASDASGPEVHTDIDLDFGERGLVYLVLRRMGKERADLDRYLRGEGPTPDWMGKGNVNVESDEVIRNGQLTAGEAKLAYTARRGKVTTNGENRDGLFTFFLATCPDDKKARIGIWFAPDPARGQPVAEADWTGTPADPAALESFTSHFRFCDGPT
jgi:hypothetical protein